MVEPPAQPGWWRTRVASLRVRVTALAVLVVGLALGVGSVILVHLLYSHLVDSSRTAAEARADSLASLMSTASDPDSFSFTSLDDDEDEFVQVLDDQGRVVAASENMTGQPVVTISDDEVSVPFDSDPFAVADSDVTTSVGDRTVIVGSSLEDARDAADSLTGLLLVGAPLMMLVVGATTWFAVGRTLAPVERIRREADEITGAQLHRRLPTPPAGDEIGRLARTMNLMLGRLEQAQQQQRSFVSDAAHELRSPVASIRQNIEVADRYPDHLSTDELLETVRSESARLERLVTALLSLARLDERSASTSVTAVDLDDLVFEEAARLRQGTPLRVDTTRVSAGRVSGDEALLAQVLRNLVDNAERHAASVLALTLAEAGDTVVLTVEDDGPGVDPADRDRVFDRFVRLDDARARDDGGSGLGLAIVHDIVVAHGGSVSLTTSRLGGACLTVRLPRLGDSL